MKKKSYKIALLMDNSRQFSRGLLRGIANYSKYCGNWTLIDKPPFYLSPSSEKKIIDEIINLEIDGIIMRHTNATEQILQQGIPTIVADLRHENLNCPIIKPDDLKIGEIAAEYFLNRGYKHFAFCGFGDVFWSLHRQKAFTECTTKAGYEAHVFKAAATSKKKWYTTGEKDMSQWLSSLPKPIALVACNDDRARQVLSACKMGDLYVPEEIAVLGIDNDELVCDLSSPRLSSIKLNTELAGFDASALLNNIISGEIKSAKQKIIVRPSIVVTRQSTDYLAIEDKIVANAINYIRSNSNKLIQVSDITKALGLSRRSLYYHFHEAIGRTPFEEIMRVRIEQVEAMLVETNMSISQITLALGYPQFSHIARFFKKEKGVSLREYRKLHGIKVSIR